MMKALFPFSLLATCFLCSCESKAPQSSTTIVNDNNSGEHAEFSSLEGKYDSGKLYIQYHICETPTGTNSSEWTINAPFKVKVTPKNIEVNFSGTYKVNGVNTDSGKKRLFIKKAFIHTILYSEDSES